MTKIWENFQDLIKRIEDLIVKFFIERVHMKEKIEAFPLILEWIILIKIQIIMILKEDLMVCFFFFFSDNFNNNKTQLKKIKIKNTQELMIKEDKVMNHFPQNIIMKHNQIKEDILNQKLKHFLQIQFKMT